MKSSKITFSILLDSDNVPEKLYWDATDKNPKGEEKTLAFCVSIWDHVQHNTLKIDLWAKDMPILDMKRFYVETIGGLAESLKNASNDDYMVNEINNLCEKLGKYVTEESKKETYNG
ncbi:MAG: gliding motility protein GldC [Cytophagales bacterium]|nr:gliding motility protein GldC [Cytophagales bacterium]